MERDMGFSPRVAWSTGGYGVGFEKGTTERWRLAGFHEKAWLVKSAAVGGATFFEASS
jgi:hypothetical protein